MFMNYVEFDTSAYEWQSHSQYLLWSRYVHYCDKEDVKLQLTKPSTYSRLISSSIIHERCEQFDK